MTDGQTPPAGYRVHRESTTEILIACQGQDSSARSQVFINPIQEFNRDLSVLALQTWSTLLSSEKQKKRQSKKGKAVAGQKRKYADIDTAGSLGGENAEDGRHDGLGATDGKLDITLGQMPEVPPKQDPYRFTLFEGLSATGLRSIRYAKEIPLLRWVQANDLLPTAADNIRANVAWNGLADTSNSTIGTDQKQQGQLQVPDCKSGKVRVSQGDCCSVLYAHREVKERFDAIDLDPYGTAAPFIDGAVQAVNDGGLLCVTCTDLAVLAGSNYPEKCYSNYGGVPVKAEYTHESALRLLLHTLAQSAARYGRYIQPMLSLSIDYYIRVFVRVQTGAAQVKKLASQTANVYVCHSCQAHHLQRLGKGTEKVNQASGSVIYSYGIAGGPPTAQQCEQCNGSFQLAGPMWADALHDRAFVGQMLETLESQPAAFGTTTRLRGMLTLAKHELDAPFYFTPSRYASLFRCTSPALSSVAAALHNGGFAISRSHASAGSIKTNAPHAFVGDIFRKWIESHPIKESNIKEGSPAKILLAKVATHEIDFARSTDADEAMLSDVKLVRYQQNPTENWGPQAKATAAGGGTPA